MSVTKVLGTATSKVTIERWLAEHPRVLQAMERAHARVVLFEVNEIEPRDAAHWFELLAGALAAAEATIPDSVTFPLFVARVYACALRDVGLLFSSDERPPAPAPRRGAFAGYFAVGEGGALFVSTSPGERESTEVVVLRLLGG